MKFPSVKTLSFTEMLHSLLVMLVRWKCGQDAVKVPLAYSKQDPEELLMETSTPEMGVYGEKAAPQRRVVMPEVEFGPSAVERRFNSGTPGSTTTFVMLGGAVLVLGDCVVCGVGVGVGDEACPLPSPSTEPLEILPI